MSEQGCVRQQAADSDSVKRCRVGFTVIISSGRETGHWLDRGAAAWDTLDRLVPGDAYC